MRHWLCGLLLMGTVYHAALCAQEARAGASPDPPKVQQPATQPAPGAVPGAIPPGRDSEDAALFASPTRLDHIGRIVVPVLINGQGPFRFIVDTGASHSAVTPGLVQKLGLPAAPRSMELNGITGTAQVPAVRIETLQAGDLKIQDTDFPVVWAPLMAGADGFLGVAGLTAQRLLVDFQNNRVVLSGAGGRLPGFMRISGKRVAGGLITVAATIGGVRLRAVIDTGSERSLGNLALQSALKQQHHFAALSQTTNVYGATSDVTPGDAQVAPIITIGDLRIADVTLVYGDFNIFKVWNMQDSPALIIGMDVLGTVDRMAVDFKHADFYLGGSRIGGSDTGSRIGGNSGIDPVNSIAAPHGR
jgi:predicted aspartyl protease